MSALGKSFWKEHSDAGNASNMTQRAFANNQELAIKVLCINIIA
jgi:hypothetical protein